MPPNAAAVAAAPLPLGEADLNRIRAPNNSTTTQVCKRVPDLPAFGTSSIHPGNHGNAGHGCLFAMPETRAGTSPDIRTNMQAPQPAEKPAPRSRKRKSDATNGEADAGATAGPAPKKRATKKNDDPLPDLSGVHLDGEEHMRVPVYDTCDTVRAKIRALLKKDGVTKAAFLRAIVKAAYPAGSTHKIAPNLLTNFMNKKGAASGNTSSVFYAAYVFFEKLRVRDGKPKGKKREDMEREWPNGFETQELLNGCYVTAHVSESVGMDRYGKTVISGPRGVMRC